MEWVNVHASTLHSPAFIGSDPAARATWLCVNGYCHNQENGGRVADCQEWGDRRWMQTCGVTRAEIDAATVFNPPLLSWDGTTLVCHFYPMEKEAEIQAKRQGGGDAVRRRWAKEKAAKSIASSSASTLPNSSANSSANSSVYTEGEEEGNWKGIGRGREERPARESWDGMTIKSWLSDLTGLPGYKAIVSLTEAEAVWLQMVAFKAMPPEWEAIKTAWTEFALASLEKAYERPLKTWVTYFKNGLQKLNKPQGRGATQGTYATEDQHAKGF